METESESESRGNVEGERRETILTCCNPNCK